VDVLRLRFPETGVVVEALCGEFFKSLFVVYAAEDIFTFGSKVEECKRGGGVWVDCVVNYQCLVGEASRRMGQDGDLPRDSADEGAHDICH
jgi:hypothetical protein